MMNFHVMTLFPDMINNAMAESITGRAIKAGHITVNAVNIRDFAGNKHNSVDDYPYGGGAGMVMQAAPVYGCYKAIQERILSAEDVKDNSCACERDKDAMDLADISKEEQQKECDNTDSYFFDDKKKSDDEKKIRVIYLSPQGKTFNQEMAREFAKEENLIFLCGHYEGIDERVLEEIVTDYVSIGDYVLTGGELPALVMMDTISRLVPGVLNNDMSAQTESFSDNLLEYPQYTRPENWEGKFVPPVLLSGNHKKLAEWYREQSIIRTAKRRPDLIGKAELTQKERELAEMIMAGEDESADKK